MKQREIKFRAWDKKESVMRNWNYVRAKLQNLESDDLWEVMQFTGLLDKNGNEIYDGDIIGNQWVEMRYGKWLCVNKKDDENRCLFDWLEDNPDNTNVLGNIYENPELCP